MLIAPGVQFKLKGHDAKRLPFSVCAPDHCEAVVNIDKAVAKILATSKTAEFSVTGSNGGVANFTVTLDGFEEAWDAVSK